MPPTCRSLLLAALLLTLPTPARAGLDPTFGGDGIVLTSIGTDSGASAMVVQPDGKVVAAGHGTFGFTVVALARYLTDGTLDPTFGTGGIVTVDVGVSSFATALARQSDGKLVAAGVTHDGTKNSMLVIRFADDGTLDPTFGTGGIVVTTLALGTRAEALVLQPDGAIVVAGTTGELDTSDAVVARYDTDGVLDPTFDGDGLVVMEYAGAGRDSANALALQADGAIVVAGSYAPLMSGGPVIALARLTAGGALDATFASGGVRVTTYTGAGGALFVQPPDHKIVVGGTFIPMSIARYLPDGTPDASFDEDGVFTTGGGIQFPVLRTLAYIAPDQMLLGGGLATIVGRPFTLATDGLLARLVQNGNAVDFNDAINFGTSGDALSAVAILPDGKIAAVGASSTQLAVIRYEIVICGDGEQHPSEQCEDGNLTNGDGCDANCTPTGCGNGVSTAGEGCDDGNVLDGDCCSSTCQRDPAGTTCTSDGNACTDDVCTASGYCNHPTNSLPCDDGDACTTADVCSEGLCTSTPVTCPLCERCEPGLGSCVVAPATWCRDVPFRASTSLVVVDKPGEKADRLLWQRRKAYDATPAEIGDPIATDDYALCLYDESGPTPTLLSRWRTRRGQCGTAPCWKASGYTFKYRDKLRSPDGIDSFVLKGTTTSPSSFRVKAIGPTFDAPPLPLPLPARLQFQSTTGHCWEATYSSAGAQRHDGQQFKGVND